jgi:hypothetical protein
LYGGFFLHLSFAIGLVYDRKWSIPEADADASECPLSDSVIAKPSFRIVRNPRPS